MLAVIIAGVVIAAGMLYVSYALLVIGCLIMVLGAIYIGRMKGDIS